MSVKLLPPGKRGNKTYYIIGRLEGKKIEVSTRTSIYKDALLELEKFNELHKKSKGKTIMSYAEATDRFMAFKKPSERDEGWHKRICKFIGEKNITDIIGDDLARVANALYPSAKIKNATKNRTVFAPASAVIQYASDNEWRTPMKVKKLPEDAVKTRFVQDATELWLKMAVEGDDNKTLMLLWLFRQGDRITDATNVMWDQIDLDKSIFYRYIRKTDEYDPTPIDDEICALLKKRHDREGSVFPWHTRWSVYNWLRPLCRGLEITFTPHRARHTLGKRLNDSGAGLKTIMTIMGHKNPKTALRYHSTDMGNLAEAKRRAVGKMEGNI